MIRGEYILFGSPDRLHIMRRLPCCLRFENRDQASFSYAEIVPNHDQCLYDWNNNVTVPWVISFISSIEHIIIPRMLCEPSICSIKVENKIPNPN